MSVNAITTFAKVWRWTISIELGTIETFKMFWSSWGAAIIITLRSIPTVRLREFRWRESCLIIILIPTRCSGVSAVVLLTAAVNSLIDCSSLNKNWCFFTLFFSFCQPVHCAGRPITSVTYRKHAQVTRVSVRRTCTKRMQARVVRKTDSVTWESVPRSTTNANRFGDMVSILLL